MITTLDFEERDIPLLDTMGATFPGDMMEEMLDHHIQVMAWTICELVAKRSAASISGAMRWPWSQEYPLRIGKCVKDSV